jgi:hypothetical protein
MTTKKPWKPCTKAAELMEEHQNSDMQPANRTRTEPATRPPYPGWRNLGGGLPNNNSSQNNTNTNNSMVSEKK